MLHFTCTATYRNKPHDSFGLVIDNFGSRTTEGKPLTAGCLRKYRYLSKINALFTHLGYLPALFHEDTTDIIFTLKVIIGAQHHILSQYDFNGNEYIGTADIIAIEEYVKAHSEFADAFGYEEADMASSGIQTYLAPPEPVPAPEEAVEIQTTVEEVKTPDLAAEETLESIEIPAEPQPEPQPEVKPEPISEPVKEKSTEAKPAKPPKKGRNPSKDIKEGKDESTENGDIK